MHFHNDACEIFLEKISTPHKQYNSYWKKKSPCKLVKKRLFIAFREILTAFSSAEKQTVSLFLSLNPLFR